MKSYHYVNRKENIGLALTFISEIMKIYGHRTDKNVEGQTILYMGTMLEYIAEKYPEDETVTIEAFGALGETKIRIFYKGEKLNVGDLIQYSFLQDSKEKISEVEALKLREVYSNYFESSAISHKYSDNSVNVTSIVLEKSRYKSLIVILIALLGGIGIGLVDRAFLPNTISTFLSEEIFKSVSRIFINSIKMLIAPLMFFTISSSISSYTDLSALGRMGRKLTMRYLLNALIAIALSIAFVILLKPGLDGSFPSIESTLESSIVDSISSVSIKETFVDFFPSNFFKSFVDSKMMQIVFVSFLFGIAAGLLNMESREGIQKFLLFGKQIFSKMANIVMWFLPFSVFCAMASTMIELGADTLVLLLSWLVTLIIVFTVMSVIMIIIIMIFGKVKPGLFLKKYSEALIAALSMGSCNSSLPMSISAIEGKLGVSKKISAITMPIGVSIHCASNCIFYIVSAFFLANIYTGTEVSPLAYPALFLTILVLGIGAPSISGAGPICVAMILPQLGVPMGLITLIIGLDPLVSMFKSACSCIEDASVTLCIAKSENQIDGNILNS